MRSSRRTHGVRRKKARNSTPHLGADVMPESSRMLQSNKPSVLAGIANSYTGVHSHLQTCTMLLVTFSHASSLS